MPTCPIICFIIRNQYIYSLYGKIPLRKFMKKSLSLILGIFFSVIVLFPSFSFPASFNVTLDDWKYEAIDRIALAWGTKYPINSRPMSRLEMARIVRNVLEVKNDQKKKIKFWKSYQHTIIHKGASEQVNRLERAYNRHRNKIK